MCHPCGQAADAPGRSFLAISAKNRLLDWIVNWYRWYPRRSAHGRPAVLEHGDGASARQRAHARAATAAAAATGRPTYRTRAVLSGADGGAWRSAAGGYPSSGELARGAAALHQGELPRLGRGVRERHLSLPRRDLARAPERSGVYGSHLRHDRRSPALSLYARGPRRLLGRVSAPGSLARRCATRRRPGARLRAVDVRRRCAAAAIQPRQTAP